MNRSLLSQVLRLDGAVLILLGLVLIAAPGRVEQAFHFQDLPPAVSFIIGMWGCAMATLGFGYLVAAGNPIRHRIWVQIGIARGILECLLSFFYLARGVVTFEQARSGLFVGALISVAYIALYPRKPRAISGPKTPTAPVIEGPSPP